MDVTSYLNIRREEGTEKFLLNLVDIRIVEFCAHFWELLTKLKNNTTQKNDVKRRELKRNLRKGSKTQVSHLDKIHYWKWWCQLCYHLGLGPLSAELSHISAARQDPDVAGDGECSTHSGIIFLSTLVIFNILLSLCNSFWMN